MKKKNIFRIISILLIFIFCSLQVNKPELIISVPNKPNPSSNLPLIFGTRSGPSYLDPQSASDPASFNVHDQVCEGLFAYNLSDPSLAIIPRLAESFGTWNGKNYTVTLRQGVLFHDGTPFNASAVKWSFDRLAYFMENQLTCQSSELYTYYNYSLDQYIPIINRTVVEDSHTIKFVLNRPYSALEALLCFPASYILSPTSTPATEVINTATGVLVGTGPYVYDSYNPDIEVNFHAFENYWAGVANVTNLRFSIIHDTQTLNNALLSGEVDIIIDPLNSMLSTFEADPEITLALAGKSTRIQYLGMNNYWINTTFRKAISHALNYSYIIEELYEGQAVRLESPVPECIMYANWSYDQALYDVAKARAYMQSMGFGVGFTTDAEWQAATFATFNYTYNIGNDMRENMYPVLVDNLDYIGIEVEDAGTTWPQFILSLYELAGLHRNMVQLYWLGWIPDYNDASNYINLLFTNRSVASNGAKYNGYTSAIEAGRNPLALMDNVQLLMEEALLETDSNLRQVYYNRIQELLVEEDMPWAYGVVEKNNDVYRKEITVFQSNCMDKVWFYGVNMTTKIDTTNPLITILSPSTNDLFGLNTPNFVITIDEFYPHSTWYALYHGISWSRNVTFVGTTGTIEQSLWDGVDDGIITLRFYANDTSGNIGFTDVIIRKDKIDPSITIITPKSNEIFGRIAPNFSISINDTNLDKIWYTMDEGGTNFLITEFTGTFNQTEWDKIGNGFVTIYFYANDTVGKIEFTTVKIEKDTIAPVIEINEPVSGDEFIDYPPVYGITIDEVNLESMWYTIDGGETNVTFTEFIGTIEESVWNAASNGYITISIYANDTVGNVGYANIIVVKDTPEQDTPLAIPGIDLINLTITTLIGIAYGIWFTKKKKKFLKK